MQAGGAAFLGTPSSGRLVSQWAARSSHPVDGLRCRWVLRTFWTSRTVDGLRPQWVACIEMAACVSRPVAGLPCMCRGGGGRNMWHRELSQMHTHWFLFICNWHVGAMDCVNVSWSPCVVFLVLGCVNGTWAPHWSCDWAHLNRNSGFGSQAAKTSELLFLQGAAL